MLSGGTGFRVSPDAKRGEHRQVALSAGTALSVEAERAGNVFGGDLCEEKRTGTQGLPHSDAAALL